MSVYLFVSAVIAPVIYIDAVVHSIGRVPDSSGQNLNFSAGLWALLALLLWPVFGPLYLVNRNDLLDRAKTQPVMAKAWRGKAAAWIAVSGLLLIGSWGSPEQASTNAASSSTMPETASAQESSAPASPSSPPAIDWNTRNPDALKNGNISRAATLFKASDPGHAELLPEAEPVWKAPWRYYGQWLCLAGTVETVTDYPPGSDVAKVLKTESPSEVLFVTADGFFADFLLMNGSGQVQSGKEVTACGYPVGRAEVPAPSGGTSTNLVLVGDWYK